MDSTKLITRSLCLSWIDKQIEKRPVWHKWICGRPQNCFIALVPIGAKHNLPNNETFYSYHILGTFPSNQIKRIQFINLFLETEIQLLFSLTMTIALQILDMYNIHCVHCAICTKFNYGFDCFNFCSKKLSTIYNWKIELN